MKRFSIHYNKLINNDFETDSLIKKHLKYINRLEINVAYPFLLEVYDDYSQSIIDKTDFISILQLIQSFVWRRFICSLPTNALNKIFMTLYQNIDKQNYLNSLEFALIKKKGQQRFPNDKEIIDEISVKDFYNIQTKNRIYFLERLENFGKNIPFFIEGNEKVTTEHILPQNPTNEWKDALGSRFNHVFEKYLNTISNLTISGNNAELGRRPFKDKRDYPEFGYTASGLWLNQYLSTIDKWTEEEIIKRNKIICDRTLNIWQYPKNVSQSINNEDEINIFDLGDVTGKKIDYYIFFDSKYIKSNYSEILCFVAKTLFDMDANRFLQTELATTLRITTNKNNLRQSAKLGQTYYIDTHGNSNKTIKKIQKVLEAFELYDELFIKFNDKQNE